MMHLLKVKKDAKMLTLFEAFSKTTSILAELMRKGYRGCLAIVVREV
jgi:hypothetical protein